MMEGEIFQILGGGADSAIMAIAVAVWRMEKRIFRVEMSLENLTKEKTA